MKNIALLFLTYGNIYHTDALSEYMEKANIYIHPKYPEQIQASLQHKIINQYVETKWAEDTIVMASLLLLNEAYKNADNSWFILCSDDSYPMKDYNSCCNYLSTQTKSIFTIARDEKNPLKTTQWWALNRSDAGYILRAMNMDSVPSSGYDVQFFRSNSHFKRITSQLRKKAADELFFLPLLNSIIKGYTFTDGCVHYTKWFDQWVSKHPTVFNRLMLGDINNIEKQNCLFIRKTLPTFKAEPIVKKEKCIIIVLGTENIDKIQNYDVFLQNHGETSNIFLVVMVDSINNINQQLKNSCEQIYYVVWNMVDVATNTLRNIMLDNGYTNENIIVVAENMDANQLPTQQSVEQHPSPVGRADIQHVKEGPFITKPVSELSQLHYTHGRSKRQPNIKHAYVLIHFGSELKYFEMEIYFCIMLGKYAHRDIDIVYMYSEIDTPNSFVHEIKPFVNKTVGFNDDGVTMNVPEFASQYKSFNTLRTCDFIFAYNLLEYDKICIVESDLVIMRCIDEVFNLHAPSILSYSEGTHANENKLVLSNKENALLNCAEKSTLNGGVMVIEPSKTKFEECIAALPIIVQKGCKYPNEALFEYVNSTFYNLPVKYNMSHYHTLRMHEYGIRDYRDVSVFHFNETNFKHLDIVKDSWFRDNIKDPVVAKKYRIKRIPIEYFEHVFYYPNRDRVNHILTKIDRPHTTRNTKTQLGGRTLKTKIRSKSKTKRR